MKDNSVEKFDTNKNKESIQKGEGGGDRVANEANQYF